MPLLFEPFDMQYEKRADLHRAARLVMLHDRLAKRLDRVECAADEVERAAAVLVEVTHDSAVGTFQDARRSNSSAAFLHLDAGQTLGL
ncbi:hypothetical protein LB572_28045 [Mesorhizobium sp. BH1-1-5]|uniref:hypothetical protein n=1 Tax=Mesorhizobium sp. BH1-1-5 TaxID=2876661 RepID=UPI001CCF0057|nr:hypothetical protein [Mesorhizobium sp. BH1-1-5]MBZ9990958.1 hypothetical protein [Mesorhizobium sp. BH1-1-5]